MFGSSKTSATYRFVFGRSETNTLKVVVISGGKHVGIMLGFILFSEMSVFAQVSFLDELFEKAKGKKRTWANFIGSKQWKSQYEIDDVSFCFYMSFFVCENV